MKQLHTFQLRVFFFFVALLTAFNSHSQLDARLDSLKAEHAAYFVTDYQKCDSVIDEALREITKSEQSNLYKNELLIWTYDKAVISEKLEKFDDQQKYLLECLSILDWETENYLIKLKVKSSLGNLFIKQRKLLEALECYLYIEEMISCEEEYNELQFMLSAAYNGIANVYYEIGSYPEAEEYFRKALLNSEKYANEGNFDTEYEKSVQCYIYTNLTLCAIEQNRVTPETATFIKKAFQMGQQIDLAPCSLYYIKLIELDCKQMLGELNDVKHIIDFFDKNKDITSCLGKYYFGSKIKYLIATHNYEAIPEVIHTNHLDTLDGDNWENLHLTKALHDYYNKIGDSKKAYEYLTLQFQIETLEYENDIVLGVERRMNAHLNKLKKHLKRNVSPRTRMQTSSCTH